MGMGLSLGGRKRSGEWHHNTVNCDAINNIVTVNCDTIRPYT